MKAYFNLLKIAMPVPPPPQELSENMRQEGLIFLHDLNRQLPALGIKKIKDALKSVGAGVEGIFMPKAYFPTPKHIVDIGDGHKYYFLHYEKPTKTKDGTFFLIDIDTGELVKKSYNQFADVIRQSADKDREETKNRAKNAIRQWNSKIDKMDRSIGLVTIPLRSQRCLRFVDSRLEQIKGQLSSIEADQSGPHFSLESYGDYQSFLRQKLIDGGISPEDAISTVMFLYQENMKKLEEDLNAGNLQIEPSLFTKIEPAIRSLLQQETEAIKQKYEKREEKQEEREQRIFEDLPPVREPTIEPLREDIEIAIPRGYPMKAPAYRSVDAWQKQKTMVKKNLTWEINHLNSVRSGLENINATVAGMEPGQFSLDALRGPDGLELVRSFKNFLQDSYGFIKKYNDDIFQDGMINSRLFGNSGTLGNVELAVEFNRLFNAIRKAIQDASLVPEKTEKVPVVEVEPTTASYFDLKSIK